MTLRGMELERMVPVVRAVDDRGLPNAANVTSANSVLANGRVILVVALIAAPGGVSSVSLREGRGRVYDTEAVVERSPESNTLGKGNVDAHSVSPRRYGTASEAIIALSAT
jgi:hypothetical protein